MKTIRMFFCVALLAALLVPGVVHAKGPGNDLFVGEAFLLQSGETYDEDLVAIGGSVTLEEGSTVKGDVVLLGSSLYAAGRITGHTTAFGGSVQIAASAVLDGELACMGMEPDLAEGSTVRGEVNIIRELDFPADIFSRIELVDLSDLAGRTENWFYFWTNPLFEIAAFLFRVLILSAVAVLTVMFLPAQTKRVSAVAVRHPALSFAVGLLSMILAGTVIVLFLLTICFSPVGLLGAAILVAAVLFGWTAVGLEVGRLSASLLHQQWHPAAMAGIGTMLLTVLAGGLWYFPCVGGLLVFLAVCYVLGAVVLTRFGGRSYLPAEVSAGTQTLSESTESSSTE